MATLSLLPYASSATIPVSSSSSNLSFVQNSSPSLAVLRATSSLLSSTASRRLTVSSIQDLLSSRDATASADPLSTKSGSRSTFGSSLFGSFGSDAEPSSSSSAEPRPSVECPPDLTRYETMAILRPDITEEQRLELTQRYEEAIIAGGGMGVEIFNRGMIPLAYNIRKKDMAGISNRFLDGIYFLFSYCAKPESAVDLQKKFGKDENVIRSMTIKVKPIKV